MKANMKIARFASVLDRLDQHGVKVAGLIMSHAGFGKTSTLRMFCDCKGYNLYTLIPSSYASDDILGLQTVTKGDKLIRLTPSWFDELSALASNGKRTLLFIDELSTCDPYIQAPLLDLIFSRALGTNRLPDNVFIISSGNYSDDLNGEFKMSHPMVNRFVILNITSTDSDVKAVVDREFDNLKTKEDKLAYLGIDKENGVCYGSVLVNTNLNPRANYSEEYLAAQYMLSQENYPEFLDYDSFADCGMLFSIPISKLLAGEYFGKLSEDDLKDLFDILETTETLSTKQKKRYGIKRR